MAYCGFGERDFGLGFGVVDEGGYARIVEHVGSGEADEAILTAAALENFVGIGERGAPVKAEDDAVGVGGDGEESRGLALRGGETEDQEIVIVVDEFDRGGEAFAENGAAGLDFFGQCRLEFGQEAGDLFFGGDGRRRRIDVFWSDARGFGLVSGRHDVGVRHFTTKRM